MSSSSHQNCNKSTHKEIKVVGIFQDNVLVSEPAEEQLDKRKLAVTRQVRENNFNIDEKI